jgi:FtsH-binding integral membrane protein
MTLFLDICTGAGLAAAAGIRPFLPALVAGILALANATIDFQGTDYSFLEKPWFLIVIAVATVATFALERARGAEAMEAGAIGLALLLISVVVGAVLFGATLADHGRAAWPGWIAGALCAALAHFAVRPLITRVRARVDAGVRGALSAYQEFAAFAGALLAVLVPPVSILLIGLLGWLLIGGRRRQGEKYAGLRILR